MKSAFRSVNDHGITYKALMFICPGCKEFGGTGLHMLPVNSTVKRPSWDWDGNLEKPTLTPSILTGKNSPQICHSFLKAGIFEYLSDCTHSLANQHIPLPDLPSWITDEGA